MNIQDLVTLSEQEKEITNNLRMLVDQRGRLRGSPYVDIVKNNIKTVENTIKDLQKDYDERKLDSSSNTI